MLIRVWFGFFDTPTSMNRIKRLVPCVYPTFTNLLHKNQIFIKKKEKRKKRKKFRDTHRIHKKSQDLTLWGQTLQIFGNWSIFLSIFTLSSKYESCRSHFSCYVAFLITQKDVRMRRLCQNTTTTKREKVVVLWP